MLFSQLLLLNILNLEMTTDDNEVENYVELLWRIGICLVRLKWIIFEKIFLI
jgi:hypothetical protein